MFPERFRDSFIYKEIFIDKKEDKSQWERVWEKESNNKIN